MATHLWMSGACIARACIAAAFAAVCVRADEPRIRRPPAIEAFSMLAARPLDVSNGPSGPINVFAFEVDYFAAADDATSVACIYGGKFVYRCAFRALERNGTRERIVVEIPDLARGHEVTVRFATASGTAQIALRLVNSPQLIHEIESLALPHGDHHATGGNGTATTNKQFSREFASTTPALAAVPIADPPACGELYAEWRGASATDAVFASDFGALQGAVVATRPGVGPARVTRSTIAEWLITYPRSASRVHFIAHYEVVFRIGECDSLVIN